MQLTQTSLEPNTVGEGCVRESGKWEKGEKQV